jgi:hypothetical protein
MAGQDPFDVDPDPARRAIDWWHEIVPFNPTRPLMPVLSPPRSPEFY